MNEKLYFDLNPLEYIDLKFGVLVTDQMFIFWVYLQHYAIFIHNQEDFEV